MTDREMEEHEMKKLIALMLALLMAGSICFALAEDRTPPEDRKPTITEATNLTFATISRASGKRLPLSPAPLNVWTTQPMCTENP